MLTPAIFAMSRIVRSDIKHTNFQDTKPILANKSWNCKHKTGDYKLFLQSKIIHDSDA